ncbi:aldehyde reductase [Mycobacterium sp. CVI_P3]|uniref:Aldehyde reductase n=1 Tax=Mycobacterium pinniadriaticum TaxID=2994102 RepID=A0ABT3SKK1_9MYCO|nr:aldehyde reductase [Mycobacterium pinniadriaticum]MCX2932976.1 aldehyde reductase [Mycobacterium pinniadriaticum]MCX2939352.1 aldehyde reductase [Mycobacterium pinniadriaticum]
MPDAPQVLVTGGSGFIAGHLIAQLIADDYRVRTTVRKLDRERHIRAILPGTDGGRLQVVVADLTTDDGWPDAVRGCSFVQHVASPFPARRPDNEDDIIVPARDGTLRVLRAATEAGVRRVVITSSFAAIGYSRKTSGTAFDETDWTDASDPVSPYVKSKTLAERAAWQFAARSGTPELAVVNPVGVFGPVLGGDMSTSVRIIDGLLHGRPPVLPRASFAVVDVRDVADLLLRAMTNPLAAGQRYLAAADQPVALPEIAAILRAGLGPGAADVPRREVPDWVIHAAARLVPSLREFTGLLGEPKTLTSAKAVTQLGWQPRPVADTVVATAQSLLRLAAAATGR